MGSGCAFAPPTARSAAGPDGELIWAPAMRHREPPKPKLEPLPKGPTVDHLRKYREAAWERHRLRCEAQGLEEFRLAEIARERGRLEEARRRTIQALVLCTDFIQAPDYITDELMRHAGWERLAHFFDRREQWDLALRCWERSEPFGHHCVGDSPEEVRAQAIARCRAKLAR